jgi:CHASE2 domain-containing protein
MGARRLKRRRGAVADWLKLLWAPAALLVVAVFDPFGLDSAASNASLVTFQRLYAPFYPAEHQKNILVVSITNADLPLSPDSDIDWPPTFNDYATMIGVLAGTKDQQPNAIFIDLMLDRPATARDPVEKLCDAIAAADQGGVPVVFAAQQEYAMPEALRNCDQPPKIASATWSANDGAYGLSYEIGGDRILTAAADLYRRSLGNDTDVFDGLVDEETDMVLMWGARPPVFDARCDLPAQGATPARQSLDLYLSGLLLNPEKRRRYQRQQKCLYHAKLSGQQVMGATSPAQRRLAAQFVDGKYVLVGAELSDLLDRHPSPVHGAATGVFLHAMALDNLLTYGPDFIRRAPVWTPLGLAAPVGADDIVQSLVLILLIVAMAAATRVLPNSTGLERVIAAAQARFFSIFVLVIISILVVWVTFFQFRWTPLNWGGVLVAGLAMLAPWNFIRTKDKALLESQETEGA